MNMTIPHPRTLAILGLLTASVAEGAITAQLSGGDGDFMTVTFPDAISFMIQEGVSIENGTFFVVLQGAGNYFNLDKNIVGTLTYSLNGGPAQNLIGLGNGITYNDLSATDLYLYGAGQPGFVQTGDVIVVSAGASTTTTGVNGPLTVNTSFQAFLTDGDGRRISANAIPEPSGVVLGSLGALGLVLRRRK